VNQLSAGVTEEAVATRRTVKWQLKLFPWLITGGCFLYLYTRLSAVAERQGRGLVPYLTEIFENVSWSSWLALMIPYCIFFFLIDTLILTRVINWFNAKISYREILPVRASSYILSIINEQVSKGAIALYLRQKAGVPGWEVGSSMLFLMFCEFCELLLWATIGVALQWDRFPPVFHSIPWIAVGFLSVFAFAQLFAGKISAISPFLNKPIFSSFRRAKLWQYAAVVAMRTPALLSGVVIYTLVLRLFGVNATFSEMLGYVPVVFFGASTPGPMRSVAIVLWVILFPEHPGEMTAFGFVQHNFFIFFNATIGLIFLRRAMKDLSLSNLAGITSAGKLKQPY
jgi:hypothetical protein